jgi:hypothetical protein
MMDTAAEAKNDDFISDLSFINFNKLYSQKFNTTLDPN